VRTVGHNCDVAQLSSIPTINEGLLWKFQDISAIYGLDYITVIMSDQQYGRISRYSDYLCLQPVT